MGKDKLIIFDTTLRDGEQSPGVTLNADEKVEIAKQLSRLGVDVCEAGFPMASQGDFEAVTRIAQEVGPLIQGRSTGKPMVITGLARATEKDIQRAFDAVKHAPLFRIHTFLATSDIHLKHKLRISREECIERATKAVSFAKSLGCHDIEFSPEDAGRSEKEFLCKVLESVIDAGATTLNIPDTVGYNTPEEYGSMMKYLIENTKGGDKVIWSCHCHNDLGLATANTLSGVMNGARQVEVTINGIGERAGNTALEEIVMAIHTHPSTFPVYHSIDTVQIYPTSQLVTQRTGMAIQANKAIVGANAFAHESGIHQDGVLKNKETYEIIQPSVIGLPSNSLVLGKHSGRNAFKSRITEILANSPYLEQLENDANRFEALFVAFKKLADNKKRGVTDQDLYALLDDHFQSSLLGGEALTLKFIQVVSGTTTISTATVCIENSQTKEEQTDAAIGHGPVNAIFSAINRIVGVKHSLVSFDVKSVTEGSDSLGKVTVKIQDDSEEVEAENQSNFYKKQLFVGQGTDEDILIACGKAYLHAVNRMVHHRQSNMATKQQHLNKRVDV